LRLLITVLLLLSSYAATARDINIAVVAIKGEAVAHTEWTPLIQHLSNQIPEHQFNLVAITPDKLSVLSNMLQRQQLDFVISQPAIYVELEVKQGISKILTMVKGGRSEFGSVILVRADSDIHSIADLENKHIAGVAPQGFGGWLVGYKAMLDQGFDPIKHAQVSFLGDQFSQIAAVQSGKVDAAVIRTGMLEQLVDAGKVKREHFSILNPKQEAGFNLELSTKLYPEWAFARSREVSDDLVRQVGLVLLQMPNKHPAAVAAKYDSWTLPYDYQPVHELLQQLQHSPYEHFGAPTMASIYDKYYWWIWSLVSLFLIVIGLVFAILLINRNLKNQVKRNTVLVHELSHSAAHDGLTGVFNRAYFMELLTDTLSRLRRQDGSLALAFIDIDNFKMVNDSYGHDTGDQILRLVVDIIKKHIREYDFIGRFGGDEFVVAFENVDSLEELKSILQRMQVQLTEAKLVSDDIGLALSAGCVLASAKEINSAKRLLMVSDQLMYLAKSNEPGGLEIQHYRDTKQDEQDDVTASVARFRRDFDES